MDFHSKRSVACGFTLIELMVTIAIAAILMVIAVPSFLAFQRSSAVMSAATSFAAALNVARSEAIKRNTSTFVRPATAKVWTSGWSAFVDSDGNGILSNGDAVMVEQPALSSDVSMPVTTGLGFADSGGDVYVRYDGTGNPRAIGAKTMIWPNWVNFSATAGSQTTTRRVLLNLVGRARVCDPTVLDASGVTTCQ